MRKIIFLLAVLLVVQVGLIVVAGSTRQQLGAYTNDTPLLDLEPALVDDFRISGPNGQQVRLEKKDGKWFLPEYFNAPADKQAVGDILEKLAGLKRSWPVATTRDAAARFKVAEEDFERHVILQGNGKKQELYVGTSPLFRKVHVRLPDSDDIMTVTLSSSDFGVNPEDWLNKKLIQVKADDITELVIGDLTLIRKDGELQLADLGPNEEMKKEEIDKLLRDFSGLRIEAVLGTEPNESYGLDTPELICMVTLKSGEKLEYQFGKPEKEDYHVLKISNRDFFFKIADWQAKPLLDVVRGKLVVVKAGASDPVEEETAGNESEK